MPLSGTEGSEARRKSGYKGKDKGALIAALTAAQQGRCKVCGDGGPLVLDHDHARGHARALLCVRCNAALGMLGEDPDRIAGLGAYAYMCAEGGYG